MEGKHMENIITKDFLEKALNKKIEKFLITSGSKPGDNYSSTMYSIEVHLPLDQNENEIIGNTTEGNVGKVLHLIAKCFPNDPARQELLIKSNSCYRELNFYQVFVRELVNMQKDFKLKETIQPAFPEVVAGQSVNFDEEEAKAGKVYDPFDNYILMVDIKKSFGFTLADRLQPYDLDHVSLVMNAMAKNHALSWIYKQKNNIPAVQPKFPFIRNDSYFEEMIAEMVTKTGLISYDIIKKSLGEQSPVTTGVKKFLDSVPEMLKAFYKHDGSQEDLDKYIRMPPEKSENNIPWKVVIQGDCWTNNMMFRYNETTGKPEDVILLDLQLVRETCPTADLAYTIYASTDSEFRKNHLDAMLALYVERFNHYCQLMDTETLPGFSAKELKRRLQYSKLFAFCIALGGFPIMLIENEIEADHVESIEEGKSVVDMLSSLCSNHANKKNTLLTERVLGAAQDMFNDGII